MDIIPVNLGVKFRPAKLGMEFYPVGEPNSQLIYEIPLEFIKFDSNADQAVEYLFAQYGELLNPKVISMPQIKRLVLRVINHCVKEEE